jgi:hypothetical protein
LALFIYSPFSRPAAVAATPAAKEKFKKIKDFS